MTLSDAYEILFGGAVIVLLCVMFGCLIRAVRGPEIADRIVSVNMLGTCTIMIICILSLWLKQSYLLDVALIYAMISFLAVVVLVRVYLGVHREHLRMRGLTEEPGGILKDPAKPVSASAVSSAEPKETAESDRPEASRKGGAK